MGKEISVMVRAPGTEPRTYLFDEQTLEIGRSPDCHVSICHEAVPRRLCSVWLEEGGRRVRVEEHPGLTNPLMRGSKPIRGGLSGQRLDLSVGPVELHLAPSGLRTPVQSRRGVSRNGKIVIAGALASSLIVWGAIALVSQDPPRVDPLSGLPASPFLESRDLPDPSGSVEKARLLYTRAQLLLESRDPSPASSVQAAAMISRSGRMLAASGLEDEALSRREEADSLRTSITQEYRKEIIDLRRHLTAGDLDSARPAATRVADYLAAGGVEAPDPLMAIIESSPEKEIP